MLEFVRNMMLLANMLEAAAKHGSLLFLSLYIGGSVMHFFGSCLAYRFLGPEWRLEAEALRGCRGGISSLLALLAKVAPEERYRFSLYMIEVPRPLSPLATLVAHALVDAAFGSANGRLAAEILGHLQAFAFGTALAALV
mmetsp:Transcript_74452/g.131660  ORF Transcript_74452/g.131660 Transcript_74452/m.131660 type:complete len:140 (+) Transcript_74452:600-1019(+)